MSEAASSWYLTSWGTKPRNWTRPPRPRSAAERLERGLLGPVADDDQPHIRPAERGHRLDQHAEVLAAHQAADRDDVDGIRLQAQGRPVGGSEDRDVAAQRDDLDGALEAVERAGAAGEVGRARHVSVGRARSPAHDLPEHRVLVGRVPLRRVVDVAAGQREDVRDAEAARQLHAGRAARHREPGVHDVVALAGEQHPAAADAEGPEGHHREQRGGQARVPAGHGRPEQPDAVDDPPRPPARTRPRSGRGPRGRGPGPPRCRAWPRPRRRPAAGIRS